MVWGLPGAELVRFNVRLLWRPTPWAIFFEIVVIRAWPLCTPLFNTSLTFLPRETSRSFSSNDVDRFSPLSSLESDMGTLVMFSSEIPGDAGVIIIGMGVIRLDALSSTEDSVFVTSVESIGCWPCVCVRTETTSESRVSWDTRLLSIDFRPATRVSAKT